MNNTGNNKIGDEITLNMRCQLSISIIGIKNSIANGYTITNSQKKTII